MQLPLPEQSPGRELEPSGQDRRARVCEVCGRGAPQDGVTVTRGSAVLETVLCARHRLGLDEHVLRWLTRTKAAQGQGGELVMQGRRLQDHERTSIIRDWAIEAGLPVSRQGSLSQAVITAFRAVQ